MSGGRISAQLTGGVMKQIAMLGLIMLSGCSLMESRQQPPPDVNGILSNAYQGGPVTAVMQRYGAPLRQMPVGENVVYSWERDRTMYFDTQPPAHWHCQMDANVNRNGVVTQIGVTGQMGACTEFLN